MLCCDVFFFVCVIYSSAVSESVYSVCVCVCVLYYVVLFTPVLGSCDVFIFFFVCEFMKNVKVLVEFYNMHFLFLSINPQNKKKKFKPFTCTSHSKQTICI